jgi:hypothetical protein
MKLSVWHCKTLYVMTKLDLAKVASVGDVSLKMLEIEAKVDNWKFKKDKFASLSESSKNDLDILECLLGEFKSNEGYVDYVQAILNKLKTKESQTTKEAIKQRFVSQLGEFGMDSENAGRFIAQMEQELALNPSETELMADVVDQTELSVKEKISTIQAGYAFLHSSQSSSAANMQTKLDKHVNFFSKMMDQIEDRLPASLDFEDLARIQRELYYVVSSYCKLASMAYDVSGVKTHVNYQSSVAKLFGEGYYVVRRDELGRLTSDN